MRENIQRQRKRTLESKRLLFIRGQVANGNLKQKREQTRAQAMRRLIDRLAIEHPSIADLFRT